MHNAQTKVNKGFSGSKVSDEDLVSHAAHGDEDAFEAIMRRYNQRLFRTARSILGNDAEAEDVLQEAYLSIWQALGGFRADAQLSTWMVRVVVNQALGRLRRKHAHIIPLDTAMNSFAPEVQAALTEKRNRQPEQLAMQTQLRKVLEMHIDRLPDLYRTVFVLRAVEEMSAPEVAAVLQIPEATVRTRLARARGILRASLANDIDLTVENAFSFDGERCNRIVGAVLTRIKLAKLPDTPC